METEEHSGGIEQIIVAVLPDGRMDRATAARYLGCKTQTLATWALRGVGPRPIRIGGRVFYRKSELDRFIRAGEAA